MKLTILITFLILSKILFSQELKEYDLKPYNKELNFKIIDENDVVEKDDSLEALIIVFKNPRYKNAELSISNNLQLKEIKLFGCNQELLKFISESNLQRLTHLFFERYEDSVLAIPPFPIVEHLTIQSSELISLNMVNASLDKLNILDIETPKLKNWSTVQFFPQLELIELNAPLLEHFPLENIPKIFQFSYKCSFKELPLNLCNYMELQHISFSNYIPIQVDKCFKKKIKKAYYSNLTVYNRIDGKVISETLSKDRKE